MAMRSRYRLASIDQSLHFGSLRLPWFEGDTPHDFYRRRPCDIAYVLLNGVAYGVAWRSTHQPRRVGCSYTRISVFTSRADTRPGCAT